MKKSKSREIREAWGLPEHRGHIRIKAVNCGKPNCKMCPHAYYLYFREGSGYRAKEEYVGKCGKEGFPR